MDSHHADSSARNVVILVQYRGGSQFAFRSEPNLQAREAATEQAAAKTQTRLPETSGNLIYAGYPFDPYMDFADQIAADRLRQSTQI